MKNLFGSLNLIAYRLYLDNNAKDLINLLNSKLPSNSYGLVLLSGKQPEKIKGFGDCNILDSTCRLQKKWNIYYIGKGKKGYNLPWQLLFQIVKKHKEIRYFILSDADEQIQFDEVQNTEILSGAKVILPQRRVRQFGEFTFERNIIEDIENAFIRITSGERNIADFQAGLFIIHRSIIDEVDFSRVKKYKWIGDLYFIEQVIEKKFNIQLVEVNTSENHNASSIFDYSGPMNEILMGTPILKMKELVDYSGINLSEVKSKMLKFPDEYLHTFFKYDNSKKHNINSLNEIKSYMDFIIGLYCRTADIYNIRL